MCALVVVVAVVVVAVVVGGGIALFLLASYCKSVSAECQFFKNTPTADLTDILRNVSEYSMKCPTSLCEAMAVLAFDKKTQIGYTQYVDNDVTRC